MTLIRDSVEKVYVVWSPVSGRRRKSLVYMISMMTVGLYAVIIALLIFGTCSLCSETHHG